MEAKKRGRPPLGEMAMSGAERTRRCRARLDAEAVGALLRGQAGDPDSASKILLILLRLQADLGTEKARGMVARVIADLPGAERRLAAALRMLKAWRRLYDGGGPR